MYKLMAISSLAAFSLIPSTAVLAQPDELPASGVIPGRYIVVLKAGAERRAVAARHAVQADFFYQHALNGFAGVVPPGRLGLLAGDPDVAWVEPDQVGTIVARKPPPPPPPGQVIPTGIARIGLTEDLLKESFSGPGIAIIDTGIDLDHPDLNVVDNVTFVSRTSTGNDDNGHGSHCAGIAAAEYNTEGVVGVASGAPLYAVKVLSRTGSGTYSAIIAGVNWVAERAGAIRVANMSLGGPKSDALNLAVDNAVEAGIVFCVAAGNDSADAVNYSPASCERAITVSAVDDRDGLCGGDVLASFSNYGKLVDIAAPGVYIYSTYKDGGYTTMSGTSMAAPHVTGATARYLAHHPTTSPEGVRDALCAAGWVSGDDCYFAGDGDGFPEPMLKASDL